MTAKLTMTPQGTARSLKHRDGRVETKFLRLKTPVMLGSYFGEWRVCWLGGWSKHRLYYLVMVSRVVCE